MWRWCCFCLVLLAAEPARAQTLQYDDDHTVPRHRSESDRTHEHHRVRRHSLSLTSRNLEPTRLGPPPTGYWYRCDAPAGFYPYIPVCGTPWRIVPSTPPR
jgi:hypothetical protein